MLFCSTKEGSHPVWLQQFIPSIPNPNLALPWSFYGGKTSILSAQSWRRRLDYSCVRCRHNCTDPLFVPDALIHARITNEERPLRRLTRKFHLYSSIAYPQAVENPLPAMTSSEEAHEAFLIELASFQLLLRKSRMVCDSERRQVTVYKQESQRIGMLINSPLDTTSLTFCCKLTNAWLWPMRLRNLNLRWNKRN